jgi:succinate dehydrogenase / fumarate reductase flavoprotein subunit
MSDKFGIFREQEKMQKGLHDIKNIQEKISNVSIQNKDRKFNQALIQFLEIEGMLLLAETIARGAIARQESRGSHKRIDYPERNDLKFLKHTQVELRDHKIHVSYKNVNMGMFEPKERVY